MTSTPEVLTVSEAADLLRLSETSTRRLIREGRLPHVRFHGRYVIPYQALVSWLSDEASTTVGEAS